MMISCLLNNDEPDGRTGFISKKADKFRLIILFFRCKAAPLNASGDVDPRRHPADRATDRLGGGANGVGMRHRTGAKRYPAT